VTFNPAVSLMLSIVIVNADDSTPNPAFTGLSPLLSVQQAAEVLGIDHQRVRRLIREGHLPAVKLSPRKTRIPREALEVWLEELTAISIANAGKRSSR
jgi:excisionase family DNA binding protein